MLPKSAWVGPKEVREDLLSWMADQGGYSKKDRTLIKYLGDKIYLEDEMMWERIKGETPEEMIELKTFFKKALQDLQDVKDRHENIGKGSRASTMEPLHQLIRNFDLMLEKETGSKQGPTTVSRRLLQRFNKQRDKIDPDGIIKDITSLENSIIWSHPDGREGRSLDWGTVPQTIFRVRKKYNK